MQFANSAEYTKKTIEYFEELKNCMNQMTTFDARIFFTHTHRVRLYQVLRKNHVGPQVYIAEK